MGTRPQAIQIVAVDYSFCRVFETYAVVRGIMSFRPSIATLSKEWRNHGTLISKCIQNSPSSKSKENFTKLFGEIAIAYSTI